MQAGWGLAPVQPSFCVVVLGRGQLCLEFIPDGVFCGGFFFFLF